MDMPQINIHDSSIKLNESLREGLRTSRENKKSKLTGIIGALDHSIDLAYCIGLMKIGIDPNYGIVPYELTK